ATTATSRTFSGMQPRHARLSALAICDFSPHRIAIEAAVRRGIPSFRIAGMFRSRARDAGDRIQFALRQTGVLTGYESIFLNLSPVDLPKDGAFLDLALAAALLRALPDVPGDSLLLNCNPD